MKKPKERKTLVQMAKEDVERLLAHWGEVVVWQAAGNAGAPPSGHRSRSAAVIPDVTSMMADYLTVECWLGVAPVGMREAVTMRYTAMAVGRQVTEEEMMERYVGKKILTRSELASATENWQVIWDAWILDRAWELVLESK